MGNVLPAGNCESAKGRENAKRDGDAIFGRSSGTSVTWQPAAARLPALPVRFALSPGALSGRIRAFADLQLLSVVSATFSFLAIVAGNWLYIYYRAPVPESPRSVFMKTAPEVHKVFVSDEKGGKETVIDGRTNGRIGSIDLGGEIGNTQYDPASHLIFANVQSRGELVAIDPKSDRIVGRHALKGGDGPHGLLIDAPKRLAFAACEGDSKLLVVDMETFDVKQVLSTGEGPDVLALDSGLERLYVATESGIVSIFQLHGRTVEKLQDLSVAPNAHTISVDSSTHEVYLPLKSVEGHPVLRIMKPPLP